MCGIVGYVGPQKAHNVLLCGLKYLEYRGYDSAGISLKINNKIKTIKSVGKVSELEKKIDNNIDSHMGIGHTRWATHGKVNLINCHPHHFGKVTLVHNGIVENFRELKQLLNAKFKTNTDSEVVAAIIDMYYDDDPIEAIYKASKLFQGTFALLMMFEGNNNLYAIRKGSPLLVGIGKNENFVASDITAILNYTKTYIDMAEYDIYEINSQEVTIYDQNKNKIIKKPQEATWDIEKIAKDGYSHFMLKEINEQPKLIGKIKAKYINQNKLIDLINLNKYEKIDIVCCGSAYHAGLIGSYFLNEYNIDVKIDVASEYRYKNHSYNKNSLVIVISQSGETADTLAALRMANENKVDTLAIVNVISSSIAKEAKYVMPTLAGTEIAVATTKGYFTQVLNLILLILNISNKNLNEYIKELDNLEAKTITAINGSEYKNIASLCANKEHIYFIGRGIDYPLLLEASLKLKEISYIHSDTYQAGELKHGPIALIEPNTIVFVLITDEKLKDKTLSNAIEAKSRGAKLILVTTDSIVLDEEIFDKVIKVPTTFELYQPLINVIPFQLIAYYIAKLRNCDIDKPKNLAKSVTVE